MAASLPTPHDGDDPHHHPQPSGLAAAAEYYARWGWLVLHENDRLLLTTDAAVSAVEMPASTAAEVQLYLAVRSLAGPVITLPGMPRRCLLLTGSADDAAPVHLTRLVTRAAMTHRRGTLVPLPPSHLEAGLVTWQSPPSLDGPTVPPFAAVVAATRAVTDTARLS